MLRRNFLSIAAASPAIGLFKSLNNIENPEYLPIMRFSRVDGRMAINWSELSKFAIKTDTIEKYNKLMDLIKLERIDQGNFERNGRAYKQTIYVKCFSEQYCLNHNRNAYCGEIIIVRKSMESMSLTFHNTDKSKKLDVISDFNVLIK